MSTQQPDATARKDAPRSRRGGSPSLAFGLIPAAGVACFVLLIGVFTSPPRYVARASFVVDWNSMRPVPDGEMAEKMRNDCRATFIAEVASLPDSEREMSGIFDRADDFRGRQTAKADVIAGLQRWLRVTLAGQTDNGDLFTIETRDDDPGAAQTAANCVLHGTVSKLKAETRAGSGLAALRSHAEAGSGSLSHLGGVFFTDPIKVVKDAQVEKRGAGYELNVLLAAVVLGGIAGGLGFLLRQFVLAVTELTTMAGRASLRTRPLASANDASPVRRQIQVPKRPILLRPLPQYCITDDLRGADGLSGLRE